MIDYDNYMHIVMASNNRIVLKIEPDDRRFFITDLSDKWYKRMDETLETKELRRNYFNDLVKQFNEEGGMEHFFAFLKAFDLKDFDMSNYPDTDIKDEHMLKEMESRLEGFLINKLQMEILYEDQDEWGLVRRSNFYEDYKSYIRMNPSGGWSLLPDNVFGREMRNLLPGCIKLTTGMIRVKDKEGYRYERANCYKFESVNKCRQILMKSINIKIDWNEPIEQDNSDNVDSNITPDQTEFHSMLNDVLEDSTESEDEFGSWSTSF